MEKLSLLGAGVGINFDFLAIRKTPNTVDSHRLIRHADREGQGESAVEALFAAYFTQGRDIGDRDVLAAIAREIGLDGEAVRAHLAGSGDVAEVHACYARTRRLGIKGVPSFIFDEQFSLSGAQEPAIFQRLFEIAEEARQGQQQADAVRAM
jgi:predicted DsbA family dithiol-disulfide isomerase